ncbi:hypothetical protein GCM10017750_42400 [Streptomyces racemochromogenes]
MHRPSGCPSCAEPLEEGDRFCGVCGYALSAAPPDADPTPTLPVTPTAGATGRAGHEPPSAPPPAPAPAPPAAAPAPPVPAAAPVPPAQVPAPAVPPAPAAAPQTPPAPAPAHPAAPSGAAAPVTAPGWEPGYGAPAGGAPDAPGAEAVPAPVPAAAAYSASAPGYGGTPAGYGVPAPGWEGEPGPDAPWASAGAGPDGPHEDPYAPAAPPQNTATGSGEALAAAPQGEGRTCVACRAGHVDTDGYCEHCGHAQPRERDHLEEELCSVAAVSDRGLRHHRNEDSFAVSATALPDGSAATVAIVCDGVSSASRPDEASAAAAGAANEALLEALPRGADPVEAMHGAILAAAAAVTALAPPTPGAQNAPACTLVGAVVSGGVLTIGWVGDSRAYWVPDDRAALSRRLTEDDSWAAQMVAAGLMGEAEAYADVRAHAITGWLGADAYDLEPHTASFRPDHPGVVVVCTDGLWNYAESAREMAQVLPADAADRPLHSAQVLVGHALDGGGHDNITVAVVPFAGPAEPHAQTGAEAGAEPEAEPQARPRA